MDEDINTSPCILPVSLLAVDDDELEKRDVNGNGAETKHSNDDGKKRSESENRKNNEWTAKYKNK